MAAVLVNLASAAHAVSPDQLALIESPPVAKIGSDYRGATLHRHR